MKVHLVKKLYGGLFNINKLKLRLLSVAGESDLEELASTTPDNQEESQYNLDELREKFKSFYIRDPAVILVGSCATQGNGKDVDIVVRGNDLSEDLKEAISFRLFRQFSSELGIPYEHVANDLHLIFNEYGAYTDYLPLYRLKMERIEDEDVHKMGRKRIKNIDSDDDRWIIAGYASIDNIDFHNEEVPIQSIKQAWDMLKERGPEFWNIMFNHTSTQVGQILLEYENLKTGVDEHGLFIIVELIKDLETSKKIWEKICNEKINAFSIKIEVLESHDVCKYPASECWTIIDECNLIEISIVDDPANDEARFEVI